MAQVELALSTFLSSLPCGMKPWLITGWDRESGCWEMITSGSDFNQTLLAAAFFSKCQPVTPGKTEKPGEGGPFSLGLGTPLMWGLPAITSWVAFWVQHPQPTAVVFTMTVIPWIPFALQLMWVTWVALHLWVFPSRPGLGVSSVSLASVSTWPLWGPNLVVYCLFYSFDPLHSQIQGSTDFSGFFFLQRNRASDDDCSPLSHQTSGSHT